VPKYAALWVMRIGLIGAFALHVHAAYSLTLMNRKARPVGYQGPREYLAANYASRTMRWSGIIVLLYLGFHLADFTWGIQPLRSRRLGVRGVQSNFVASFSRVPVAVLYIVANLAARQHIFHGAWSMFQSLGVNNPRFNAWRRYFAIAFAAVIVIGNVSLPVAVLTGIVEVRGDETMATRHSTPRSRPARIEDKWENHKFSMKLVNPNNKRKFKVLIVGTRLAGASAAATLAELGYDVEVFTYHDSPAGPTRSPPRAASTPPRTTATTATRSTGCSTTPSRAATSAAVRPTSTAWPRCRWTSSTSAPPRGCRSPASTAACSTTAASVAPRCHARSTPGARPDSSCCWAPTRQLMRQVGLGTVKLHTKIEMLDVVIKDGRAVGIVTRDLVTGEVKSWSGHAVVLATGGYSNVYYLSTNAM
jgi:succinate dehydrogenase/fumarate reductase cytochrome b subunit (b558 family)